MLSSRMYAVAVLLLGAAVGLAQTTDGKTNVLAVAQPYQRPKAPAAPALPPLLDEGLPIVPVQYSPDAPPPLPLAETRQNATAGMPGSLLSVETVGPASIAPDQPLAYEIVVRNVGANILGRVRVEDVLPPGAKLRSSVPEAEVQNEHLTWNLGNLDPGVERHIKVDIQPGAAAGEVVLAPSGTFTLGKPWRTRIARPPLGVTQTVSETGTRGGIVKFQISVTNYSDQVIETILLHDTLPIGLIRVQDYEKLSNPASAGVVQAEPVHEIESDIAKLMPGESRTITLETRAAQAGRFTNRITASAVGGWKAASEATVLVTETPLVVRLEAPKQALVGQELDFRLEVSNPGPSPAANVRVTQTLPDGVELINASAGATPDPARSQVCWPLGTLPAGQTQTLTLRLRGKTANDWIFKTSATTDGAPEAKSTHTLHLEGGQTLMLEIVRHDEAIDLGTESVYEIRVYNPGTTAVPGVHLSASVSEGLLVLNTDGPTTVVSHPSQPRTIVFQPLPQLPDHSDAVYHIRVRGQTPGNERLLVQVTADQMPKPIVQQAGTRVMAR